MSTAIASVEGLRFEYPGVRALDDVSFELDRGSVTALVGPNGAGKSTLLRCMAGLDSPVLGRVEIDGVDVLDAPREAHRRIGYLSDFFGVYEALSVRRCLTHAAAIHGMEPAALPAQVEATAAGLGLDDRLEQAAGTLSRGLRQRLAIGQAIIHKPRLLLLDEPAAGLDPEARHALATLFRRLQSEGMTLIVSSHILAELDEYSTHMLVLRQGQVVEQKELRPDDQGRVRTLRVELAEQDARLAQVLAGLGIVAIEIAGTHATFEWSGEGAAQAELLRKLVAAELAVVGFGEVRENLHQSYLRTVSERAP